MEFTKTSGRETITLLIILLLLLARLTGTYFVIYVLSIALFRIRRIYYILFLIFFASLLSGFLDWNKLRLLPFIIVNYEVYYRFKRSTLSVTFLALFLAHIVRWLIFPEIGIEVYSFITSLCFLAAFLRSKRIFLFLVALSSTVIGAGSRVAMGIVLTRATKKVILMSCLLLLIGSNTLVNLEAVKKLDNSFSEITEEKSNSGLINQRAIENMESFAILNSFTSRELFFGRGQGFRLKTPFLPELDVPFIPHNQFLGILIDFGLLGLILNFILVIRLFDLNKTKIWLTMVVGLFFLFKHGWYDVDLGLSIALLSRES